MRNRRLHRNQSGHQTVTNRLVIQADRSQQGTTESAKSLVAFLKELADSPEYLNCGNVMIEKFSVFHDGDSWVLEGESKEAI